MLRASIVAILLSAAPLAPSPAAAEDARALAQGVLDKGAKLFDTRNAKAMADTYTGDAVFALESKDNATGVFKTEEHRGRAEIEAFYRKLFENAGDATTSKNTVEYAKQVAPDLLVITGTFQPDDSNPLGLNFVQVRVKDGDQWLLKSLHIFLLPES